VNTDELAPDVISKGDTELETAIEPIPMLGVFVKIGAVF
jgi:hypothetical protein